MSHIHCQRVHDLLRIGEGEQLFLCIDFDILDSSHSQIPRLTRSGVRSGGRHIRGKQAHKDLEREWLPRRNESNVSSYKTELTHDNEHILLAGLTNPVQASTLLLLQSSKRLMSSERPDSETRTTSSRRHSRSSTKQTFLPLIGLTTTALISLPTLDYG